MTVAAIAAVGIALGFAGGVLFAGQFGKSEPAPVVEQAAIAADPSADDPPADESTPAAPSSSLADIVRNHEGIGRPPAPEDWRIIEGRILGMESGLTPQFPYLRGEYNMGLAREPLIKALRVEFPALQIQDGSNGATGELISAYVAPDCQVIMYGTWQNIHLVAVVFAVPSSAMNERKLSEFIIASDIVAGLASGEKNLSNRVGADWIRKALKQAKETGDAVKKIDIDEQFFYEVSSSEMDWDAGEKYTTLWFRVASMYGPIGARTARGETDDE